MLPLGMSDSRRQLWFERAQAETYDWDHCCFKVGFGEEEQSVGERKRGCDDAGHLDRESQSASDCLLSSFSSYTHSIKLTQSIFSLGLTCCWGK